MGEMAMRDDTEFRLDSKELVVPINKLIEPQAGNFPLLNVMEALPAAIYTTDANGRIDLYNRAAVELWGREPDYGDERWCGSWRLYHPEGTPMPRDECPMARALRSGQAIKGEETVAERPDGTRVTFLAYPTPMRDSSGAIIGGVSMLIEVTGRKAADAQLNSRIEQLHALSELGMLALSSDDLQDLFDRTVVRLAEALQVEFAKILELRSCGTQLLLRAGIGWKPGLVGQACVGTQLDSQAGYALSVDEPVIVDDLSTETRFNEPSLLSDHGVVSGLSTIIYGRGQKPFGVLGAHTSAHRSFSSHDVYFLQSVANILAAAIERKSYKDRQEMLVREYSHRVKNNVSVIQAIARQAGRQVESIDSFMQSFEGRLAALSQAHDLLTASSWSGASLGKLVALILAGQVGEEFLDIDIEDVLLSPEGAQAMTFVLHELMTNAVKYGALSNGKGRVEIKGRRERDGGICLYRLSWRETGGPQVGGVTRQGFGSKLIGVTVERQCGGTLAVDWRPEGLAVNCALPLSSIAKDG
jgi:PAS domain S-box-containing protein